MFITIISHALLTAQGLNTSLGMCRDKSHDINKCYQGLWNIFFMIHLLSQFSIGDLGSTGVPVSLFLPRCISDCTSTVTSAIMPSLFSSQAEASTTERQSEKTSFVSCHMFHPFILVLQHHVRKRQNLCHSATTHFLSLVLPLE